MPTIHPLPLMQGEMDRKEEQTGKERRSSALVPKDGVETSIEDL